MSQRVVVSPECKECFERAHSLKIALNSLAEETGQAIQAAWKQIDNEYPGRDGTWAYDYRTHELIRPRQPHKGGPSDDEVV